MQLFKLLRLILVGIVFPLVFLQGCVTVYDQPDRVIDKQSALESNVKLGMSYLQQGSRENASRAFFNALDIDKKSAEAHQGVALVHQLNGETEQAEARFKKALASRADFSMAAIQTSYGRFLLEQDRDDEALKYFTLASTDITYVSRPEAIYLKGKTAEKLGDTKLAATSYKHSLNIDNKFSPAALELADLAFKEQRYPDAKKYLDLYGEYSQQSARSLWLGIRIERIFGNADKESSYAMALKNLHPYSNEYLEYKKLTE